MPREIPVPKTYRVDAAAYYRDGTSDQVGGESYGEDIEQALDNVEFDPPGDKDRKGEIVRITLDLREVPSA